MPQTSRRHLHVARSADRSRDRLARQTPALGISFSALLLISFQNRPKLIVVQHISRDEARARAQRANVICAIDGRRSDTRTVSRNDRGGVISDDVETRASGRSPRRNRRRSLIASDTCHRAVLTLVRYYLNSTSATRLVVSDALLSSSRYKREREKLVKTNGKREKDLDRAEYKRADGTRLF